MAKGPLLESVRSCAVDASLNDRRFRPVTAEELDDLSVSISILDFPRLVRVERPEELARALRPHRDGAILVHGGRRSTYLPSVWESIPEPREFLSRLCIKQGSPADCWLDPATSLYRYSAYEIAESDAGKDDGSARTAGR
jgi:AmmeMemoRadiSam system protein A